MKTNNWKARLVGIFFLLSNVTFIFGAVVLVEPVLAEPDYLLTMADSRNQLVIGALMELVNALAYLGIAVLVYPLFRKKFESLALGYVSLRVLEFVAQMTSSIAPLLLIKLGADFVGTGAADAAAFQALGSMVIDVRSWGFQMVSFTFSLGALIFYYVFYQIKALPRFISIWGMVGAALVFVNLIGDLFGFTALGNLGFLMLANEVFLGFWLIIKGFNPQTDAK
jgi:hypothetical protein